MAQNTARCLQTPKCYYITSDSNLKITKAYLELSKLSDYVLQQAHMFTSHKRIEFNFHEENISEKNTRNIVTTYLFLWRLPE